MEKHKKQPRVKVLLSKSKMDVHDRGVRYLARRMLESGMEVVLSRHGLIDEVANIALQEDADVIGLSFSVGGHIAACERLQRLLKEKGIDDKLVIVGGIIPDDDVPTLNKLNIAGVFGAGSSADEAISFIKSSLSPN